MKKIAGSFNLKLWASFLAVILTLSLFQLSTYRSLFRALEEENRNSAGKQLENTIDQVDEELNAIQNQYVSLCQTILFRRMASGESRYNSAYDKVSLYKQMVLIFSRNPDIKNVVLFLDDSKEIISTNGIYERGYFFGSYLDNIVYTADFWRSECAKPFTQKFYPESIFTENNLASSDNYYHLIPMTFKVDPYSNVMILLMVDVQSLLGKIDASLAGQLYIYSDDRLLFGTGRLYAQEVLDRINPKEDNTFLPFRSGYLMQKHSNYNNFLYVSVVDESAVNETLQKNILFNLIIASIAFLSALVLAFIAVRRFASPVRRITRLLGDAGRPAEDKDDLLFIQNSVAKLLTQQKQYVRQLEQQDNVVSNLRFHSEIKNIYTELPQRTDHTEGMRFFILYIKMYDRPEVKDGLSLEPNHVHFMMKQILQNFLGKWFEQLVLFQLEENEFVAKIGTKNEAEIGGRLKKLQEILENQADYMFFTVVQSRFFQPQDNLSEIYQQVLQASQYAFVRPVSQFLIQQEIEEMPREDLDFSAERKKHLSQAVHDGDSAKARELTEEVLCLNLEKGIRRIDLVVLCNRLINILMRDAPQPYTEFSKDSDAQSIYGRVLACETPEEYLELLGAFASHAAEWARDGVQQNDPVIEGIKSFLEKNYSREFTMDELAESVMLSKSYLSTYFKAKTGVNLSGYIQQQRIRKAVVLLEETDLHINDISTAVGIGNANTFIRVFRKYMGVAPSEYRRQQLKLR